MDVAEFYDTLETKRMARLDGLVQQYNSIESLLIKVMRYDEHAPAHVQTGLCDYTGTFLSYNRGFYIIWRSCIGLSTSQGIRRINVMKLFP